MVSSEDKQLAKELRNIVTTLAMRGYIIRVGEDTDTASHYVAVQKTEYL